MRSQQLATRAFFGWEAELRNIIGGRVLPNLERAIVLREQWTMGAKEVRPTGRAFKAKEGSEQPQVLLSTVYTFFSHLSYLWQT